MAGQVNDSRQVQATLVRGDVVDVSRQDLIGRCRVKLRCTRSGAMGIWCLLSVVTTNL